MQSLAGSDPFGIVGQVLDAQFRVDRFVGEGGFSAVYRGLHLGLDEPLAIKCLKLPPSLSADLVDQFAKRFRDESRILYRLSQGNLNVVRSIACNTWQAPSGLLVPFMVLEWMEGRSLANEFTIRRTVGNQGRPIAELVKIFAPAADGIAYAHTQGVLHRDLNPGNLFLAATPQGTRMKVLDFGVAKILDDSALNIGPRIQTVGQIRIFAPGYGAPEQFDDALGKVTAASDVYSFALILLEALRDRPVNDGTHLGEFAQRTLDPKTRPTPGTLGIEVPAEVEQVFARATALDPRGRWQTAAEFWKALALAAEDASQQKHARAAAETPSLGMPMGVGRSTQQGMGGPPPKRPLDKTMPIGAVSPKLNLPGIGRPAAPAPAPEPEEEDMPTRVGRRSPPDPMPAAAKVQSEQEDEVTQVRTPDAEMLREFAEAEAPQAGGVSMNHSGSGGGGPPPKKDPLAGTLMMPAGGFPGLPGQPAAPPPPQPQPPPPAQPPWSPPGGGLGSTVALAGPSPSPNMGPPPAAGAPPPNMGPPLGAPSPNMGPPLAAGAPPQGYLPPQQHLPPVQGYPPQLGGPPPHGQPMMPQGMPPHVQNQGYAQPQQQPISLPPSDVAGVPKKGSAMLLIAIAMGAMLLVGIGGITVYVMNGRRGDATTPVGSSKLPTSATAIASAPPPSQTAAPTAEPNPAPAQADAGAVAAADTQEPPPPSTAAAANTPDPTPAPQPAQQPQVQPAPAAQPAPQPVQPSPAAQPAAQPAAVAVKDAGPPVDPNAFNEATARSRLAQANGVLVFCNKKGQTGPGSASVTFGPDGTVTTVSMDPPYAGTPAGDCVMGQFKRTKVNPFQGAPKTLKHSFDVPK